MLNLNISVIDDDPSQRDILSNFLQKIGCQVVACSSGEECLHTLQSRYFDVVITDVRMPGMDGLQVLEKIKQINPEIQVLVVTAFGTIEDAVRAMRAGAWDYLTKPIDLDDLENKMHKIAQHNTLIRENQLLRAQLQSSQIPIDIIYKSQALQEVLNLVARVSQSNATVLIQGESGTGKELIARAIHAASERKDKPFVAVNCAAIPENLFESAMFGHEKGAFTGAIERTKGLLELANSGTLFLDEVADIPLNFQVKLLRVIQEREFQRVGSTQLIKADIRIISATNKNLEELVARNLFRADLYFRLKVIPILIPPLRERRMDIAPLTEYFLNKHAKINRRPIKGISSEAMSHLLRYNYPGNVRELENIIERAVILARGEYITTDDLPPLVPDTEATLVSPNLNEQVAALEKRLISDALQKSQKVQTRAAELLGISERVLRYKVKKYGLG